ncbi:hypothetical protein FACS1894188_05730 [Clostridia bacterium]|nr:hypothetical protein FACS1894188_05730 [Clostridia bacterium]
MREIAETVFQVCFGVGLGYGILSVLLGVIGDISHFGHIDGADIHADGHFDGAFISPFKPVIIAAFLLSFGGAGLLGLSLGYLGLYLCVSLAFIVGLVISYVCYRFVYLPLIHAQNTSSPEQQSLIGQPARVTESILQGMYGQITYVVNGNTFNSPAKTEDGAAIARGETVTIVSIVANTYYVK